MPVPSKDDNNVPQIGPRARYNIVMADPGWVYHRMLTGRTLDGLPPADCDTCAGTTDPAVSAGMAEFKSLVHGGLFTSVFHYKLPIVVEAIDNTAGATLTLVRQDGSLVRAMPAANTVPFMLSPGECIKAVGGTAGSYVGFLMRIADTVVW